MSDVVKTLRKRADGLQIAHQDGHLMDEAADEIERLARLLEVLQAEDDGTYSGDLRTAMCAADQPDDALPPLPDAADADPVRFYRQLSAAYSQRLARAVAYLREVGNDYPGSSCQQWCLQRAAECEVIADPTTACICWHGQGVNDKCPVHGAADQQSEGVYCKWCNVTSMPGETHCPVCGDGTTEPQTASEMQAMYGLCKTCGTVHHIRGSCAADNSPDANK